MPRKDVRVVKVNGPTVLQFGNGFRIRIQPMGAGAPAGPPGRRGRKPGPATQALTAAMEQDRARGRERTRAEYHAILREAGHKGSPASASIIVTREGMRVFGKALQRGRRSAAGPRRRKGRARKAAGGARGRKASPATAMLRERLETDKANGGLREAAHYVRWLVDKAGIGLRKARPMVYRELRAAS